MESSKPARKQDPSYEVFLVNGDEHKRIRKADGKPWKASRREAAAELAASTAGVKIDADSPAPRFLVIKDDEFQIIEPRVKVETKVSWEALPEPPPALRPPEEGKGQPPAQGAQEGKSA